jgi:hypothetical protein
MARRAGLDPLMQKPGGDHREVGERPSAPRKLQRWCRLRRSGRIDPLRCLPCAWRARLCVRLKGAVFEIAAVCGPANLLASSDNFLARKNSDARVKLYTANRKHDAQPARPTTLSNGASMTSRRWPISHVGSSRSFGASILIFVALLFSSQLALAQFTQQGPKLVGTGGVGNAEQGYSVSVSADGNTAIVGGPSDNSNAGAAWVYTRSNGVWTQQGSKLIGNDAVGPALHGNSVALSADGNTAIVGGPSDNSNAGAAWVYTRSNGVWTQQGAKLVGTGAAGAAGQGQSVALSSDGNTAIVGGPNDNSAVGAAWVFTRSNGVWTQQGAKLVGTPWAYPANQGYSVALSGDGNTAIVGGPNDNFVDGGFWTGAAWVYTRSNGVWTQQGSKLTDGNGLVGRGYSVALSGDGNTAIVGGYGVGAAWVYTRSNGLWTQQGSNLVGTDALGNAGQGYSVALSGDGNTAIVGASSDNSNAGAAWVFVQPPLQLQVSPTTNIVASGNPGGPFSPASFSYTIRASSGSVNYSISGVPSWLTPSVTSGATSTAGTPISFTVNANANSLGFGTYGPTNITFTSSDTGQGTQTRTATLAVNAPVLQVTPTANIAASGTQGGPLSPSSFSYTLSATFRSVNYSISGVPNWLTPSSTSGAASSSGTTVTFTVNANANSLTPNTYVNSISFNNTDSGQGNTTRVATLTVNAQPVLQVTPSTNIVASGTQGGPFSPSSFQYQLSASTGSANYSISGLPNWLTASSTSGTASTSASTVTFTVNANATGLAPGSYGPTNITFTNSDTGQGTQTRTATLAVNAPVLQVAPAANISATGNQGALPPSSFQYQISANGGTVNYAISGVPSWLSPSSTSGNVSSSGTTVTFTMNANANSLSPGTYGPTTITFTNTDTNQGTQARTATLTVNAPVLQVTPTANILAVGNQGALPLSSFQYQLSANASSVNYSISGVPNWLTPSSTSGTLRLRERL